MKSPIFFTLVLMSVFTTGTMLAQTAGDKTQTNYYAEIVYVQGEDIVVLSNGRLKALDSPLGERLYRGDQVQTGGKTTAELVIMPRKSRLRLAENTVVTISDLGTDGSTGIELVYGRLRSKVASIVDKKESFNVKLSTVVAAVRGTDFGCDMLLDPSAGDVSTKVYCFEGSVAVSALSVAQTDNEAVIVESGGMALVTPNTTKGTFTIQKTALDDDIRAFWKLNEFTTLLPTVISEPATTVVESAAPSQLPAKTLDLEPIRKGISVKNSAIIGSTVLVVIGAALGGTAYFLRDSDPQLSDRLLFTGALTAAVSVPSLILAVSIDPLANVDKK